MEGLTRAGTLVVMTGPALPLVLSVDGDVSLFDSLAELAIAVEGVDVADGLCLAFDAHGHVVRLVADGVRRRRWTVEVGTVAAELADPLRSDPEELACVLRAHLLAITGRRQDDDVPLAQLLARCQEVERRRA